MDFVICINLCALSFSNYNLIKVVESWIPVDALLIQMVDYGWPSKAGEHSFCFPALVFVMLGNIAEKQI